MLPLLFKRNCLIVLFALTLCGCAMHSRQAHYQPPQQPVQRAPDRSIPGGSFYGPGRPTMPPNTQHRPPVASPWSAPSQIIPPRTPVTPNAVEPVSPPPRTFAPAEPLQIPFGTERLPIPDAVPVPDSEPAPSQKLLPRLLGPSAGILNIRPSSTPDLQGWVRIEVAAPQQAPTNGTTTVAIRTQNVGNKAIDGISLVIEPQQELKLATSNPRQAVVSIRQLLPGESRDVSVAVQCEVLGRQTLQVRTFHGQTMLITRQVAIDFVPEMLSVQLAGPNQRIVGQRAEFNLVLENSSSRDLHNVKVRLRHDAPLAIREMTLGGQRSDGAINWHVGDLRPYESITIQAEFDCRLPSSDAQVQVWVATDDSPVETRQSTLRILPGGGDFEVSLFDETDPVTPNQPFEMTLVGRNIGLNPQTDVIASLKLPQGCSLQQVEVVVGEKRVSLPYEQREGLIAIAPIGTLRVGETVTYRFRLIAADLGLRQIEAGIRTQQMNGASLLTESITVQQP